MEAATRPARGRFTKPVTLLHKSSSAIVAIDRQGQGRPRRYLSAPFPPKQEEEKAGPWKPVPPRPWKLEQAPGGGPEKRPVRAGLGPHGELMALWGTQLPPSGPPEHKVAKAIIETSIQPATGTWQPPVAITPENSYSSSANLALAANGQATAIWLREPSPGEELIETADYEPV